MTNFVLKNDEKLNLVYAEFKNGCRAYLCNNSEEFTKYLNGADLEAYGDSMIVKHFGIELYNGIDKSTKYWNRFKTYSKLKHIGYLKPYSILCNINRRSERIRLRSKLSLNKKRLAKKFK